ncbi:MAG: ABC-2 transporter permease [Nanoarchaeota archaeon]|nr:ABC-2 transporter permease [Nanoarchaeota archaeon]MBU4086088.1 ABC-2 transporter permease [Nanoarchaeota archaeon]
MRRESLLLFFLLIVFSLSYPVLAASETDFNNKFCKDFANNYSDARNPEWVTENTEKCLNLLENYSLVEAINTRDLEYCNSTGYKLSWDDNLKFLGLQPFPFVFACKVYFVEETGIYSVCNGAEENKAQGYFSSANSRCVSYFAIKEKNLSILDYYLGVNEPNDGNSWSNAFVNFTSREHCKTKWSYAESVCLNYLAGSTGNCEDIKDKGVQSYCFYNLAIKENNFDICLKIIDSRKELCIQYFAVKLKDIGLCDSVGSGKEKIACRNTVPLSFSANQAYRIVIVLLVPLALILLGVFVFARYSRGAKMRYLVISAFFLLYYLSWIFVVSGDRIPFNYLYIFTHGALLFAFFSVVIVLMQAINLLLNVDIFLSHFVWSLLEFFVFLFYFVMFPGFFKIESKKLKYVLIISFSILTLVILLASAFFWFALSQARI